MRQQRSRVAVCLGTVIALHIAAGFALRASFGEVPHSASDNERLLTVFIQARIVDAGAPAGPDISVLRIRQTDPLESLRIDLPPINFEEPRNGLATSTAPVLQAEAPIDMVPYLHQAALLPGEGATVVLRVQVLESGQPGEVEVDVSSGSAQVDRAAIAYARTRRWYAGYVNGAPHSMWIRWGVRLQA